MAEDKKWTEGGGKQKQRPAIQMKFGVGIHSDDDKFHLWDGEQKDVLFDELENALKKAKKHVTQVLSTRGHL